MSEWESNPGCLISHSGYLIIKPWRTCFDQCYIGIYDMINTYNLYQYKSMLSITF